MLEPYRVLDFTDERGELGPMLLGDLGADVIRVEPPEGTPARRAPPLAGEAGQSLQFLAFNRNKRSIVVQPQERELLAELIAGADFLFESWPGGLLESYGMDFDAVRAISPAIVHVCVSPYGRDGPRAGVVANDLAIAAMGGPVSLQGDPDRAPVRLSVPQVWRHAGAEAAVAAMAGLARRLQTGEAQFVDLSAQCAMTWTMLNAMDAYAIQGADFVRNGSLMGAGGAGMELLYATADSHVVALPMSGTIRGCLAWMIEDGVADESLHEVDWEEYDASSRNPDAPSFNVRDGTALCRRFFRRHTTRELYRFGLEHGVSLAPVNSLAELLALDHLQARDYWRDLDVGGGVTARGAGAWAKPSDGALRVRAGAPGLDEHGEAIRAELARIQPRLPATDGGALSRGARGGTPRKESLQRGARGGTPRKESPSPGSASGRPLREDASALRGRAPAGRPEAPPSAPASPSGPHGLPFAGLKVVDFAWVGVGPISTKFLADHGATVVRVESAVRPDVLRGSVPAKDGILGLNRSQFFGNFNTSKLSITLDMKHPEARDIARRLVAWADAFVESFAPGAIGRMGLGYEEVKKLNPGIVMASTCLMGQTGPARSLAGYGYHTAAIAGFYGATGWPDRPPCGPWVAYTDTIAPRFVTAILAAALDRRRRTGEGCYLDLAQIEASLHFLGPELLDLQVNGRAVTRLGNRSPHTAPQGCYPCLGDDQWLAVGVDTDDQWRSLCAVLGREDLAGDAELATQQGRQAGHDRIDEAIAAWTCERPAELAMRTLVEAGVPAGAVQRSRDLLQDEQYEHRGFYRYLEHPEMGHIPYAGHQYRIAGYDNGPQAPAPLLGQHSFEVLSGILGLSDESVGAAYASGAVT